MGEEGLPGAEEEGVEEEEEEEDDEVEVEGEGGMGAMAADKSLLLPPSLPPLGLVLSREPPSWRRGKEGREGMLLVLVVVVVEEEEEEEEE